MSHVTQDICPNENPRVLILVRGGVAEFVADPGVDVFVVDYDNDPDAILPSNCNDLIK